MIYSRRDCLEILVTIGDKKRSYSSNQNHYEVLKKQGAVLQSGLDQ
jgi:hypothetical protein